MPSRVIASLLGLTGFAAAVVAGLLAHNPAPLVLTRALLAMSALYVIGRILGALAQRALADHLDQYKAANPVPVDLSQPGENTEPSTQDTKKDDPSSTAATRLSSPKPATSAAA